MNNKYKYISQPLSKKIHDKAKEKGFELPESEYEYQVGGKLSRGDNIQLVRTDRPKELCASTYAYTFYKAYDIAELGEMIKKAFDNLSGTMINDPRGHFKRLWQRTTGFKDEAEVRGNLCFYLLKNDLL